MKMDLFKGFKVANARFNYEFNLYGYIERVFAKFEADLSDIFEQEAVLTRVPIDSPPQIARFALRSRKNRVLEVSLVGALYKWSPADLPGEEALVQYESKAKRIFDYLKTTDLVLESFSSTFLLHFPLKDPNYAVADEVLRKYTSINKPGDLIQALMSVEYMKDAVFYKEIIQSYDVREKTMQIAVPPATGANFPEIDKFSLGKHVFVKFNRLSMPVVEAGLAYQVGVLKRIEEDIDDCYKTVIDMSVKKARESDKLLFAGGDYGTGA